MIPPKFKDLGKGAKDIFDEHFHFGVIKVEHKSKSSSGVKLTASGTHTSETGRVSSTLESEYKIPDFGLTFVGKWSTANVVTSSVEISDKILKGLKQVFEVNFEPHTGKKCAAIKNAYKRKYLHTTCDLNFPTTMPCITASAVFGADEKYGYLGGLQIGYDTGKQQLSRIDYAVGLQKDDVTFHGAVVNRTDFVGSVYQRLNKNLESAVSLSWASATHATKFAIGCKYDFDDSSFVKAKVDNNSLIGLAYCSKLRDGVQLTLSGLLDGKNIENGAHKLGLALEFES